jgi:predicted RNase H-like HicB family nuclease
LEGCYTFGDDLKDALEMAEDALALTLYGYEEEKKPVPQPSDRVAIKLEDNEFVNYVVADTLEYRKRFNNKAVKKTLTIPEWLNEVAVDAGINFSQALQEALVKKLNLV